MRSQNEGEDRFWSAVGAGIMRCWGELPQEAQRIIYEAAIAENGEDDKFREELAVFLHKHHPRTGGP